MRNSWGAKPLRLFFEPLQLHLQQPDLLEQLGLLGLLIIFGLALLAPGELLAGDLQQLLLPLADLDRVAPRGALHRKNDRVVGGDLLDRLAATDRLHGDHGLELGPVGAALTHWWEPRSEAVPRIKGY